MPEYLLAVFVACIVVVQSLLMPLYLKPGKQLRRADHLWIHVICVVAYSIIGVLASLIFQKWGATGLLLYLAFLLLTAMAVRMLERRHKH